MGLFFYTQKGSIISMVDLPTTEIIEPLFVYPLQLTMSHKKIVIFSNSNKRNYKHKTKDKA
ncbi:hypothetical protein EI219_08370 [Streptococcus suis]|uniref:Uncharacterized protein n=1 Tax=Streptococcus suis TaxID=1307 RepID=A0A3R8T9W8_STRSU|nr:hypothetical protein EI219_08370 [Streptococcus suis]